MTAETTGSFIEGEQLIQFQNKFLEKVEQFYHQLETN